jgi:geranylgeranyl diphosphate synthase type II
MDIKTYMKEARVVTDARLKELLPAETAYPEVIHQAMAYSVFAGGKRFRPMLALAACETVSGQWKPALDAACAMECIHTYSLIHDDLPGMDNDDYRRGKLTNHKVFGEGMAILAGDALLTYAFEILSGMANEKNAYQVLQIIQEVSRASGTAGMIGGQVVDIISEQTEPTEELLHYIHNNKTGALIVASVRMGAILGGADETQLKALTEYAHQLGLAFQITDDILDVVGDESKIGKPVGSDEKNEKATFPSLFGLDQSRVMAKAAVDAAVAALEPFGDKADMLVQLAEYLLSRES